MNYLKNNPTENIIELNELIYTGIKLVSNKIGILQRNHNLNTKLTWEIRLEGQIKKVRQARLLKKEKHNNTLE